MALMIAAAPASAQVLPGTPVDRNVADTGANAASLRVADPGIGQFGVGSLLVDRFSAQPYQPQHVNPYAVDPRASQRYLLQSPGFYAMMDRPDYIGPSPQGGWVFNQQTLDGTEILTLTPANTVYILSPDLLQPKPVQATTLPDHPSRVLPQTRTDPYALIRDTRVSREAYAPIPRRQTVQRDDNYRHPEIIERERKLREEREHEAEAERQREAEAQPQPQPKD